jgi:hypothetical protein
MMVVDVGWLKCCWYQIVDQKFEFNLQLQSRIYNVGLAMLTLEWDLHVGAHTKQRDVTARFDTAVGALVNDLIARGETIGMFQIESRAQIASILHTRPAHLYDIVVQIALIRPGPIQARFVHPYTQRRLGLEKVTYAHPDLEPILKRTQGIPIFQEQAMAIAMALGKYSGSEADELRRTMGNQRKKDRLLRALQRLAQRLVDNRIEDCDLRVIPVAIFSMNLHSGSLYRQRFYRYPSIATSCLVKR